MSPAELYPTLQNGACVTLPAGALAEAERAGFVAMRLEGPSIRAWKGKDGPCHDTGRTAVYLGAAAAALDDDAHLLAGRVRLCEKTARLYRTAYAGLIEVSDPDPALMARLESDPAPFDCDTFEADARALAAGLEAARADEPRVSVLYPGPFRLLILRDGTLIPRGRAVSVSRTQADALVAKDGARLVQGDAPAPDHYGRLFRDRGPAALLASDDTAARLRRGADEDASLFRQALTGTTESMRRRLLAVLERGEEYFILVGSDPSDKEGCCPSDDVGAANALVRAGALEAWCSSPAAACPATVYAFAGEIRPGSERPSFTRNEPLRARALELLRGQAGRARRAAVRLFLWAVLAFGATALLWSLWAQWTR